MATPSVVKVGCTGSGYCLRVEGPGTMRNSPAVHAFVTQALDRYLSGSLIVDLSACDYLDSTFLGCLVDLHRRYGTAQPPRFALVVPPALVSRLLGSTHLDRLFHLTEPCPPTLGAECELPPAELDRTELGRHLLSCHRRLAEIEGPNQAIFQGIADRLAADLGTQATRTGASGAGQARTMPRS